MTFTTVLPKLCACTTRTLLAAAMIGACAGVHADVNFHAEGWSRFTITGWEDDQGQKLNKIPAKVTITPAAPPGVHHDTPRNGDTEARGVAEGTISGDMAHGASGSSLYAYSYAWGQTSPAGSCASDASASASVVISNASTKSIVVTWRLDWSVFTDTYASDPAHESAWAQAEAAATFRQVFPAPPGGGQWPRVDMGGKVSAAIPGYGRRPGCHLSSP